MADAVPILISYVDREQRYRFVNRAYERWFGVDRSQIEGKTLAEVLGPEAYDLVRDHAARALAGESVTFEAEHNYQGAGARHIEAQYVPDIARDGEIPGYYVLVNDITDRRKTAAELERMLAGERRRGALLDLGQKLRDEADPIVIAQTAARMLTEQFGVARAGYAEMDLVNDLADIVADDGGTDRGVARLSGQRIHLEDFGPLMSADMRAGRVVAVGDVALDDRTNATDALEAYAALGVRAFMTISLIKAGRLSAYLFLAHDEPRAFSSDEIAFVADVAELIWISSERARSDLALKRAVETERLLIREVDHRAKNVLAVVQSLAQLTPFHSKEQYVEALSGRIGSLARAHSLLSNARWSGVDLHDLLRLELDPYRCADGVGGEEQLVIEGPPVLIDAQGAQSLALVLHELATNASKYGALARPEGRLSVTWRWDGDGALRLVWREEAGARVTPPQRRGFGSTLIESAVKQAAARVTLDWRPEGLEVRTRHPDRRPGPRGREHSGLSSRAGDRRQPGPARPARAGGRGRGRRRHGACPRPDRRRRQGRRPGRHDRGGPGPAGRRPADRPGPAGRQSGRPPDHTGGGGPDQPAHPFRLSDGLPGARCRRRSRSEKAGGGEHPVGRPRPRRGGAGAVRVPLSLAVGRPGESCGLKLQFVLK
ncbi:HWE histidine kinase domain-containing protein [Caulobacter sp. UC70_42]|uniref:HWE histidine kinase domain-containing protein n=1 Tax=Caulobacter sp. UC70_42 TaxID=3374551 RepID=UPI00375694F4